MREHDEAVSQERWPWLEAVNMIEMLSYLGTSELSEQHVTRELGWVITGGEDNTFNGVVRAQLSEANVDRVIDEVAQRFQERHYIARLGGEPAGGLSLFLGQEATGIYNVEVAEPLRRRGVGTAMTRYSGVRKD